MPEAPTPALADAVAAAIKMMAAPVLVRDVLKVILVTQGLAFPDDRETRSQVALDLRALGWRRGARESTGPAKLWWPPL